ncbi:MAG: hypothetical protein QW568_05385 [Candidatus Anstonellaceae archaeon]
MRLLQNHSSSNSNCATPKIPKFFPLRQKILSTAGALAFSFCVAVLPGCSSVSILSEGAPTRPIEVSVRGWHAEVTCYPANSGYSYEIKSSTLSKPVKIGVDGETLRGQGAEIDRSNPGSITLAFSLITHDTVRISAVQKEENVAGKYDTTYSLDTTFAVKSYKTSSGSTVALVEDTSAVRQAQDWVQKIDEINSDSRIRKKAALFVPCSASQWEHSVEFEFNGATWHQPIEGSTAMLVRRHIFLLDNCGSTTDNIDAFHEIAHIFFSDAADSSKRDSLEAIFERRSEAIDPIRWLMADSGRGNKDSIPSYYSLARKDPFFRMFSEDTYTPGVEGHPQDNSHELFASASTVLKYFADPRSPLAFRKFLADTANVLRKHPEDFFLRLSELEKEDSAAASDAREVARLVAGAYLPKKPFPLSVYLKLGIFTEEKQTSK